MKKINFLTFGFIFAGCFLGAGYLSGNELMQFFGDFGTKGIWGLVLSISLIGAFGIMILFIAKKTGAEKFEDIVFPNKNKILSSFFGVLQAVLVFAIIVIMVAGASQLLFDAVHLRPVITAAVFCVVTAIIACTGLGGISKFFSLLVPAVALFTVIAAAALIIKNGMPNIPNTTDLFVNELLGNWVFAAVTYLSYSIFSSVGMISPLISRQKNRRTYIYGTLFGTALLLLIAISILLAVFIVPDSLSAELPMFAAIGGFGKAFSYIYAVLLFGGMFGTALTSLVSLSNYARLKFNLTNGKTIAATVVFSVAAYLASLFGFDKLIGTVYPLFGYFGILILALILINFIKLVVKKS
ncbi:MAG: hypothetical protein IJF35_02400 [Clostridia bacterium]|nr:hypothetical protein [Clostridia bacterium]